MKIRNGFVSNSSSSSFIVAGDKEFLQNGKLSIEIDITKYGTMISTVKELDEYFIGQHIWIKDDEDPQEELKNFLDEEPYWEDKYNKMLDVIKEGTSVVAGSCSDDSGDPIETMLCCHGFEGVFGDEIEIIESERR